MRPPVKIALLLFSLLVLSLSGLAFEGLPRFPPPEPDWSAWGVPASLKTVAARLRAWHAKHGCWPTNAEGLAVLPDRPGADVESAAAMLEGSPLGPLVHPFEPTDFPAGVLSDLLVPYVYENRREPGAASLPGHRSGRGVWYVELSDGIAVYDPIGPGVDAAHRAAMTRFRREGLARLGLFVVVLASFVTAAGTAVSLLRGRRRRLGIRTPGSIAATIGVAVLAMAELVTGCGPVLAAAGPLVGPRRPCRIPDPDPPVAERPVAVREWERTLDERVAAGVIPSSEREARLGAFAAAEAALLPPGQRVAAPRPRR